MKIVIFGNYSTTEKVAVAKFEGIETYVYERNWTGTEYNYEFVSDIEEEENRNGTYTQEFVLFTRDFGDVKYGVSDNDEQYLIDKDILRTSEAFVKYVEENPHIFLDIYVKEIDEKRPFVIEYDEILEEEETYYVDELNIYTIKDGAMTSGYSH